MSVRHTLVFFKNSPPMVLSSTHGPPALQRYYTSKGLKGAKLDLVPLFFLIAFSIVLNEYMYCG